MYQSASRRFRWIDLLSDVFFEINRQPNVSAIKVILCCDGNSNISHPPDHEQRAFMDVRN
jgi:hypothetical protein